MKREEIVKAIKANSSKTTMAQAFRRAAEKGEKNAR